MSNKNFTLKFSSSIAEVTLPYKLSSVTRLKIRQVRYVTATADQNYMIIKISGWTDNNYYYDGSRLMDYTKLLLLPHLNSSLVLYENTNNNVWDCVKTSAVTNLSHFRVEVLIDGNNAQDITALNPLYLEFFVE